MNTRPSKSRQETRKESRGVGIGLRLRIWIGCLAGALVAAVGLWIAMAWSSRQGAQVDSALVWLWLPVIATAGVLIGIAMAMWLDHAIVSALRGFVRALTNADVAELRGLPAASGWGEVSSLSVELQRYLTRYARTSRAFQDLTRIQNQIEQSRALLERWVSTEHWVSLPTPEGPFGDLATMLNDGQAREVEVREQAGDVARQIYQDIEGSLDDARGTAEQTEAGFVEATSLLTTIRELQRLAGDLERAHGDAMIAAAAEARQAGASAANRPSQAGYEVLRQAATRAIGELVQASGESVHHLSSGLMRVREVGEQVQVLGNRATLLALNVMVAEGRSAGGGSSSQDTVDELKALATDVRAATDRAGELTHDVQEEVAKAARRMHGVRERVAEVLDQIPQSEPLGEPEPVIAPVVPVIPVDLARTLERVREMIQDATAKGERLSSAGERASRAAERLVRRLEESAGELEGLVVRLRPVESEPAPPPTHLGIHSTPPSASEPDDASLRLLDAGDIEFDPPRFSGREGKP